MATKPKTTSVHSVRAENVNWSRAAMRAKNEGTNINAAINELLEGYGRGLIDLPKVQVIKQYTRQPDQA